MEIVVIKPPASEAEAAKFEASVGYVIALVRHGEPPQPVGGGNNREECCRSASQLAAQTPGAEFSVFVAIKTFKRDEP